MATNYLPGLNYMLAFGSLFAAQSEASAQRAQGDFEAGQFLRNARFAELQAEDATRRGALSASRQRGQVRGVIGSQQVAFASQGVDVGSRSVADVAADSGLKGELDAITIENNAFREAFGFRVEAAESRAAASGARTQSRSNAGNTLITGGLNALNFTAQGLASRDKPKKDKLVKNNQLTDNPRFNKRRGL